MKKKFPVLRAMVFIAGLLTAVRTADAQRLYLVVDRDSGEVNAVSSADIQIDAYTIKSRSGLLLPESWSSLTDQGAEGWVEAQPRNVQLSELNWPSSGTLTAGQPVGLGQAYAGTGVAPSDEDLRFEYGTPQGVFGVGQVRYTGAPQIPALLVDRQSGAVQLSNPTGFEIGGYSIISEAGSLLPDGLTNGLVDRGVEGFVEANLTVNRLSELSLENSHTINAANPLAIGNAFTPGGAEDLEFEFLTVDGTLDNGRVVYSGALPEFTLQVDLLSGQATLANLTSNAIDLIGYSVASPSGGLSVENWAPFGTADWMQANPTVEAVAELNLSGSRAIESGASVSLGNIFVGAQEDLILEYSTPQGVALGLVDYQLSLEPSAATCADVAASRAIPGDLNGDNAVNFSDFLVLSSNFNQTVAGYEDGDINCDGTVAFADFLTLSTNFNQTAGASAQSVPEPAGSLLCLLAVVGLLAARRKR